MFQDRIWQEKPGRLLKEYRDIRSKFARGIPHHVADYALREVEFRTTSRYGYYLLPGQVDDGLLPSTFHGYGVEGLESALEAASSEEGWQEYVISMPDLLEMVDVVASNRILMRDLVSTDPLIKEVARSFIEYRETSWFTPSYPFIVTDRNLPAQGLIHHLRKFYEEGGAEAMINRARHLLAISPSLRQCYWPHFAEEIAKYLAISNEKDWTWRAIGLNFVGHSWSKLV